MLKSNWKKILTCLQGNKHFFFHSWWGTDFFPVVRVKLKKLKNQVVILYWKNEVTFSHYIRVLKNCIFWWSYSTIILPFFLPTQFNMIGRPGVYAGAGNTAPGKWQSRLRKYYFQKKNKYKEEEKKRKGRGKERKVEKRKRRERKKKTMKEEKRGGMRRWGERDKKAK